MQSSLGAFHVGLNSFFLSQDIILIIIVEMHNSQCHDHFQSPSFECIAEKRINRILATINNLRSILIIVIVVASMQSIRCEHSAIIRSCRLLAHSDQSIKLRSTYQKSHLLLQSKEREKTNNIKTTTKATGGRESAKNYRKLLIEIWVLFSHRLFRVVREFRSEIRLCRLYKVYHRSFSALLEKWNRINE